MTGTYLDRLLRLCSPAADYDSIGRRLLRLEISLEDYYVELTILCLGHLDEKLASTHLLPVNEEDCAKVGYAEGFSFDARQ